MQVTASTKEGAVKNFALAQSTLEHLANQASWSKAKGRLTVPAQILFPHHMGMDCGSIAEDRAWWLDKPMQAWQQSNHVPGRASSRPQVIQWNKLLSFGSVQHALAGYKLPGNVLAFINTGTEDRIALGFYQFDSAAGRQAAIDSLDDDKNAFHDQTTIEREVFRRATTVSIPDIASSQFRIDDRRFRLSHIRTKPSRTPAQFAGDCVTNSFLTLFLILSAIFDGWETAVYHELFLRGMLLWQLRRLFAEAEVLQTTQQMDLWHLLQLEYPHPSQAVRLIPFQAREAEKLFLPAVASCSDSLLGSKKGFDKVWYLLQLQDPQLIPFVLQLRDKAVDDTQILSVLRRLLQYPTQSLLDLWLKTAWLSVVLTWTHARPGVLSLRDDDNLSDSQLGVLCHNFFSSENLRDLSGYLLHTMAAEHPVSKKSTALSLDAKVQIVNDANAQCGTPVYGHSSNEPFLHYLKALQQHSALAICLLTLLNQIILHKNTIRGFRATPNAACAPLERLVGTLQEGRWPDKADVFQGLPLFHMDIFRGGRWRSAENWRKIRMGPQSARWDTVFSYDYEQLWQQNLRLMQVRALRLWHSDPQLKVGFPVLLALFGRAVPPSLRSFDQPTTTLHRLFNDWVHNRRPQDVSSHKLRDRIVYLFLAFLQGSCEARPRLFDDLADPSADPHADVQPAAVDGVITVQVADLVPKTGTSAWKHFVRSLRTSQFPHLWLAQSGALAVQVDEERLLFQDPWVYRGTRYRFVDAPAGASWAALLQAAPPSAQAACLADEKGQVYLLLLLLASGGDDSADELFHFPNASSASGLAIMPVQLRLVVPANKVSLVREFARRTAHFTLLLQLGTDHTEPRRQAIQQSVLRHIVAAPRALVAQLQLRQVLADFPGSPLLFSCVHTPSLPLVAAALGFEPANGCSVAQATFMLATGLVPSSSQRRFVQNLLADADRAGACTGRELLMGKGKTRVILPLFIVEHTLRARATQWVVPDHLLQQARDSIAFFAQDQGTVGALRPRAAWSVQRYTDALEAASRVEPARLAASTLLLDELDTLADPLTCQLVRGSDMQFHSLGHSAQFITAYCEGLARCIEPDASGRWHCQGLDLSQVENGTQVTQRVLAALAEVQHKELMVQYGPGDPRGLAMPYASYDRPRVGSQFQSEDVTAVLTVMMWKSRSRQLLGKLDKAPYVTQWLQAQQEIGLQPLPGEPSDATLLQALVLPRLQVAMTVRQSNFHDLYFGRTCLGVSGTAMVALLPSMGWTGPMVPDQEGRDEVRGLLENTPVQNVALSLLLQTVQTAKVRCLIDAGAVLAQSQWAGNKQVADAWQAADMTVFYFEGDRLVDRNGTPYAGADSTSCVYFDQGHTVGTDVPLDPHMRGMLLIRPNTTLKAAAQALFRMRHVRKGNFAVVCAFEHWQDQWPAEAELYSRLQQNEQRVLASTAALNLQQAIRAQDRVLFPFVQRNDSSLMRDVAPYDFRTRQMQAEAQQVQFEPHAGTQLSSQHVFLTANLVPAIVPVVCETDYGLTYSLARETFCSNDFTTMLEKLSLRATPAAMAAIVDKTGGVNVLAQFEIAEIRQPLTPAGHWLMSLDEWSALHSHGSPHLVLSNTLGSRVLRDASRLRDASTGAESFGVVTLQEQLALLRNMTPSDVRCICVINPHPPRLVREADQSSPESVIVQYEAAVLHHEEFSRAFPGVAAPLPLRRSQRSSAKRSFGYGSGAALHQRGAKK